LTVALRHWKQEERALQVGLETLTKLNVSFTGKRELRDGVLDGALAAALSVIDEANADTGTATNMSNAARARALAPVASRLISELQVNCGQNLCFSIHLIMSAAMMEYCCH
jgi:hypothetical protein